jgi:hypothetical protein
LEVFVEPPLKATPVAVPLDQLFLDPNNPRLGLADKPGYADVEALFDAALQNEIIQDLAEDAYDVAGLVDAIVAQGWTPVDNVLAWPHPDDPQRWVVVEGNRRRLALERIRTTLIERERAKLDRMRKRAGSYSADQLDEQEAFVARLQAIVDETASLRVVEVDAATVDELDEKLPRVLAVRHITGTKHWGGYAEDLWLLRRYEDLAKARGGRTPGWDSTLVNHVADEASLSTVMTKRKLRAASWESAFRAEWEADLPDEGEFKPSDHYLFELIAQRPWLQSQLGIGESDHRIPDEGSKALFRWIFKHPRPKTGDLSDNTFYRHENIREWDAMHRYDQKNGTDFAAQFDVEAPDEAPRFAEIEAEWRAHKASRSSQSTVEALIRRLKQLTGDALQHEGLVLKAQLEELRNLADSYIKMIEAVDGAEA